MQLHETQEEWKCQVKLNSQSCGLVVCVCVYVRGWFTQGAEYISGFLNWNFPACLSPAGSHITPLLSLLWVTCSFCLRFVSCRQVYIACITPNLPSLFVCHSSVAAFRWFFFLKKIWADHLRLLFTSGNSQSHGDRDVVGEASQLGDKSVLLYFL